MRTIDVLTAQEDGSAELADDVLLKRATELGRILVSQDEDLLREAAARHMVLDFHGANKPTGLSRTWPNELTREAYTLLRQLPLNFLGNVEGRELYSGDVDVIVCDGFIGNVALKVSEGLVNTVRFLLKESLKSTISSQVGFLLSRRAFEDFKKRLDYAEYGGAPLLGIKGICIVGHGSSNATALKNAIRVAAQSAETKINDKIEKGLSTQRPRREPSPAGLGAGSVPV